MHAHRFFFCWLFWLIQVMFLTATIFNVVVAALLFFADNPDRCVTDVYA